MEKFNNWFLEPVYDILHLNNETIDLIEKKYGESHRHYHTLRHVIEMCKSLLYVPNYNKELVFAALFHDIIYDTQRSDNEESSVFCALEHVNPTLVNPQLVKDMILATKSHNFIDSKNERDDAINTFLKADLSILWSDEQDYQEWYAPGIRSEYSWVPIEKYIDSRTNIIYSLFSSLFHSGKITDQQLNQTHKNMRWEIDWLTSLS